MASDRVRGGSAIAVAGGLFAAGSIFAWALRHGFYGTTLTAALIALWLAVLLWWAVVRPRDPALMLRMADESHDERIMLRTLLDQAPGALLTVEGARVRALNRAARTMFATDDVVLPTPQALLSADIARLRHAGRSWRIDRATTYGSGVQQKLIALVDVEPQEHAAEARATRDLLRVLGHEVMNALAPITSLAESALAVMAAPERRDRLLPEILETLARRADGLRRFTEAYRQVARLPEPALAPVALTDLFADLKRLFDARWQGRATLKIVDPGNAIASLDADQLVQALTSLLQNGVEAALATDVPPVVRLAATRTIDRLTFHVADNGPGIDPTHLASIFLPFFTTKADGNGVGLAAVRQIAQSHGGDVTLRAAPSTTFDLSVPQ